MATTQTNLSPLIIALDPGFGNTKICIGGKTSVIQSVIVRPKEIGLAGIGLRRAGRKATIVSFEGHEFAIGHGAWSRGEPLTSMDYGALASTERLALFYGAVTPLLQPGHYDNITLVVGLPVPLLQDAEQAKVVLEGLKRFKRCHAFTIDGHEYALTITHIKVLAQPVGSYVQWLYPEFDTAPRPGGSKAEVAVVDIGFNTLDLFVIQNGQVVERHVGGAEVGVRRLLELSAANGYDLTEMDAKLRDGSFKPDNEQMAMWLGEILAAVKRTFPSLRRFSAVIPSGGGALVLGERLRFALATKGAAVHWPDDPVTANVVGLWLWAKRGSHGS